MHGIARCRISLFNTSNCLRCSWTSPGLTFEQACPWWYLRGQVTITAMPIANGLRDSDTTTCKRDTCIYNYTLYRYWTFLKTTGQLIGHIKLTSDSVRWGVSIYSTIWYILAFGIWYIIFSPLKYTFTSQVGAAVSLTLRHLGYFSCIANAFFLRYCPLSAM